MGLARRSVGGIQPPDLRAKANIDAVVLNVVLEILNPRIPTRELAVAPAARAKPGLRRHPPRRIEPQPVVAGAPGRADLVGLLDHDHIDACPPQCGRRRKPGGARTDHDRLRHRVICSLGSALFASYHEDVPAPEVMCSITDRNSSVGEKSTYSESSSASGAWPEAQ